MVVRDLIWRHEKTAVCFELAEAKAQTVGSTIDWIRFDCRMHPNRHDLHGQIAHTVGSDPSLPHIHAHRLACGNV